MATTFKSLGSGDATTTRTLLHESIPVTGSIPSGTYGGDTVALGSEGHIKTYSHGMFESVFDYPYLSSSANHIFDITAGYASTSDLSGASNSQNAKKINIYNQMAQVLMGYDETGSVRLFDEDGDIVAGGTKLKECYFVNFSRLLTKDEIKKGTFEMEVGTKPAHDQAGALFTSRIKITDASGSSGYFVNSPAGEYGVLFASSSAVPAAVATMTITDAGQCTAGNSISLVTTGGDTVTITGHASANAMADTTGESLLGTFDASTASGGTSNNNAQALAIATVINLHDDFTAVVAGAVVTITQNTIGTAGNTTITVADNGAVGDISASMTIVQFAGGLAAVVNGETLGTAATNPACGLLFYQAGVAVLSGSVFSDSDDGGILTGSSGTVALGSTTGETGFNSITSSTIQVTVDALRNRLYNLQFNNTTELNSTIYFCRVNNTEFNYSSNPTYLSTSNGPSEIVVKNGEAGNDPLSYITSVGLYSADNELLAVAKVSEPLKKDPSNELTLRVRLDY